MEITPFKGVMTVKPTNQPTDQPTGGNEGSKGRYTSNKSWIQKVMCNDLESTSNNQS